MAEFSGNEFRSLFRIAAVLGPIGTVFIVAYNVLTDVCEFAGFTPSSAPGQSFVSSLDYIGTNATLFNSAVTVQAIGYIA